MMQKALNEVKKKVKPPDKPPVNSRQDTQEPLEGSKFRHVNPFSRQMSKDKLKLVDTYIDADNGMFSTAESESRQGDRERKNSIPKKKQPHIEQFHNAGESKLNFIEKLIKSKK